MIDGRFELLEHLGSGGIGSVYLAQDLEEKRPVALKFLNRSVDREDVRRRFRREFHILSRIRHPRVVRTHAWGIHEGLPYFSMDYLEGRTLAEAMADGSVRASLRGEWLPALIRQVGEGLAYIHAQGTVHRDLKSSNLMIQETGDSEEIAVTILDLGLARLKEQDAPSLTQDGVAMGTVEYMSPEQGKGMWVDQRSDLYSLGVILYEVLAGAPPFTGDSPVSVVLKHIREAPQPLPALSRGSGQGIQDIVLRLLEKEPIDRYQSAENLLLAVERMDLGDSPTPEKAHPGRSESPARTLRPQFLGREQEMKALRRLLAETCMGKRCTVLVSGEAGIGKSRLVEELQGEAAIHDMHVLKGACSEGDREAYGSLIEALGRVPLKGDQGSARKWFSDLLARGDEVDPYAVQELLMESLLESCRERPMLLCIEDIQWADELTVQFLRLLQRDPDDAAMMVCITCRQTGDEPVLKRLEGLLLGREMRGITRLHLEELTAQETNHLAASMLGERQIPDEIAQALYRETGGHPLFAMEMVRALTRNGTVQLDDAGEWRWDAVLDAPVPDGVMEILKQRLDTMTPLQQRALDYACVLKGAFTIDLIVAMWRGDELGLIETLEDLTGLGAIRSEEDGGGYRFSHALFQRAVYDGLPSRKRRLLHREAGRAIETLGGEETSGILDDLAYHFSRSGDKEKAGHYLRKAGKQALDAQAYSQAVEIFEEAMKHDGFRDRSKKQSVEDLGRNLEFLCDYARALSHCGRYDDAVIHVQYILTYASDCTQMQKAQALLIQGHIHISFQRYEEAEQSFLEALAICQKLKAGNGELKALSALSSAYDGMGRIGDAVRYSRLAAERCRHLNGPMCEAGASFHMAYAAYIEHRFDEVRSLLEPVLGVLRRTEMRNHYDCLTFWSLACFYTGDHRSSAKVFQRLKGINRKRGKKLAEAMSLLYLGKMALEARDPEKAAACGRESEMLMSEVENRRIYWARALLAEAMVQAGDIGKALAQIDHIRPGTDVPGETRTVSWRGIGHVLSAAGRYAEAAEAFGMAVESLKEQKGGEWALSVLAAGRFHFERKEFGAARTYLEMAAHEFQRMGASRYKAQAEDLLQQVPRSAQAGSRTRDLAKLSEDRQAALYEVSEDLARILDLDPLLDRVLDRLLTVSRAERAIVALREETADAFQIQVARSHNLQETAAEEISRGVIRDVIAQNEAVMSIDASVDERLNRHQSVLDYNIRSVLCVPLCHGEAGCIGALYTDHRGIEAAFSDADQAFLATFSNFVSIAVINARLYTQVNEKTLHLQREVEGRNRLGGLVGQSEVMQHVFTLIEKASGTGVAVLVRGETGTGKELAARAIHYNSRRKGGPFLSQNCAALSPELLQSELFGHKKGAFTGAVTGRAGLFEAADGGTVFLDEIGDASPQVQSSLLRVLQEGEIRRVGENATRKVDVRVIAATNLDLETAVRQGDFREDLYYRLRVLEIEMPPLRKRIEDIPLLTGHLLRLIEEELEKKAKGITEGAVQALMDYAWPGNVRQLGNEIRRAVAIAKEGGEITPDLFSAPIGRQTGAKKDEASKGSLKAEVEALEKRMIRKALAECDGNITRAAARLGMTRNGLQKKIRRYGLQ